MDKEILKELIHFNTINDQDNKGIINYIEKYFQKMGFQTEYKSNCLVMSNKEECNIGFLGHTDTVSCSNDWTFNPFELTERDKKLYGLGTSDMKGSIAAIMIAIAKIDFSKTQKGIKLFFTYDEEIGFSGIKELVSKDISFPKYMVIGEPTNNEIINGSKGLLELKIQFKGVSSHSSKPEEGINAIEKCFMFLSKLKKYYQKLQKETVDDKKATMNIGVIKGGRSINIVPDNCEVLIDFRTISKRQNVNIIKMIKRISDDNTTYEVINNINPFISVGEKNNISDFITEASFIQADNKYILGVGPVNAHKKNEFISIDSLTRLEKQYIEIIKKNI